MPYILHHIICLCIQFKDIIIIMDKSHLMLKQFKDTKAAENYIALTMSSPVLMDLMAYLPTTFFYLPSNHGDGG